MHEVNILLCLHSLPMQDTTCYVYFNVHGLPESIIHSYYRKAVDYQT